MQRLRACRHDGPGSPRAETQQSPEKEGWRWLPESRLE